MRKRSLTDKVFNISNYIFLSIVIFLCFYPFYYILIYSLSDPILAYKGITFIPRGFTLDSYKRVFQLDNIFSSVKVSFARTIVGTILSVGGTSFFAYLVTRQDMPLRKAIYRFTIITMYMSAGLIPYYLLIKHIGLRNSFLVYVVPGIISPFNVVLVKTYIESIPSSIQESAFIDGASNLQIFIRIIFPLSMPIIATITVFTAVGHWNSYFDNYFFVSKESLQTLQIVLFNYLREAEGLVNVSSEEASRMNTDKLSMTPETIRMTMTVIVSFPILFIYPMLQKYFVKGIMLGSVKG